MYSKYYLDEGKTSKIMVKEITSRDEFENVVRILKEHHIGGYLVADGHIFARVGCGKNSLKANACKNLGFRYVAGDYWTEAYSKGVEKLGSFM